MDNDLMARRLRPPSEPPRPQNGHSPAPSDPPPWAPQPTAAESAPDEVPWDKPADDSWPPTDTIAQPMATDEQPAYDTWPPTPTPPAQPANGTADHVAADAFDQAPWGAPSSWPPAEASNGSEPTAAAALEPAPEPVAPVAAQDMAPPTETAAPAQAAPPPWAGFEQTSDAADDSTDAFVGGRAPWDAPEMNDDRPAEMFEPYDEMVPRVTRAVAAASAAKGPDPATDPDDAMAPVLNDVAETPRPTWPAWTAPAEPQTTRGTPQPIAPAPVDGKVVGPTPPDDLFNTAASGPVPPETHAANQPPVPTAAEIATLLPAVYSTSVSGAPQPLVLRIELAIVDESNKLRPADHARSVGPWSDNEDEAESVTPRHPEFEPRNHIAPVVEPEPEPEAEPAAPEPVAPAIPAATEADVPWALPPLEPVRRQPEPLPYQPQYQQPEAYPQQYVQPQPYAQPQYVQLPYYQQVAPPATPVAPPWAEPQPPVDTWTLNRPPADPLAALPAASFAPAQPAVQPQPAPTYAPAPVFEPAPPAAQPAPAPAAPAATTQSTAPARQANKDQSDLWFLASEPEESALDAPAASEATATQPSRLVTTGLTIAMAIVVIFLILVFVSLMTNLLH